MTDCSGRRYLAKVYRDRASMAREREADLAVPWQATVGHWEDGRGDPDPWGARCIDLEWSHTGGQAVSPSGSSERTSFT